MKLIKIIKEMEKEMDESGFSSIGQSLRGVRSKIYTIAIITAHNPCAEETDDVTNAKKNKELETNLRDSLHGYRPVIGDYGVKEDSFVINNIKREYAIKLGTRYKQETIIWGVRTENGMRFDLIQTFICDDDSPKIGTVVESRDIFINSNNFDEFFTIVKGRKFRIPFYDDDLQYADWNGGKINKNITEEDDELLDRYIRRSLEENRSGRGAYELRGKIKKIYRKYLTN